MDDLPLPVPARYEPLTRKAMNTLRGLVGRFHSSILQLHEVDLERGCGIIDSTTRCVWTRSGRRITIWATDGGSVGASVSDLRDLYADPSAREDG